MLTQTRHTVNAIVEEAPPISFTSSSSQRVLLGEEDASANTCREHWKEMECTSTILLTIFYWSPLTGCATRTVDDPVCASLYMYSSYALSVLRAERTCASSPSHAASLSRTHPGICAYTLFVDRVNNVTTPHLPLTGLPFLPPLHASSSSLGWHPLSSWPTWSVAALRTGRLLLLPLHVRFSDADRYPRVRWRRGRLSSPCPRSPPSLKKAQMV